MIRALRISRAYVAVLLTAALLLNSSIVVDAAEVHDVVNGVHQLVAALPSAVNAASAAPATTDAPLPVTALTALPAPSRAASVLETISSAETLLNKVAIGSTLSQVHAVLGDPWFVGGEAGRTYWTYGVDSDRAWLMIGVTNGVVESVQVTARADVTSHLTDASNVALNMPMASAKLPSGAMVLITANGQPQSVTSTATTSGSAPQAVRFYGTDRQGNIERIGLSTGDATMPLIVRWYRMEGLAPSRAIPFSRYSSMGEAAYLQHNPDEHLPCEGGGSWHIVKHERLTYGGVPLDGATAQCGRTEVRHTTYFNLSMVDPHGFDADPISQAAMLGTARPHAMADAVAAHEMSASGIHPDTGTTGQIWSMTPFDQRCIYGSTACDPMLQYINDPANPLNSITVTTTQNPYSSGMTPHAIRTSPTPAGGIHPDTATSCSFGGGVAKCGGVFLTVAIALALVGLAVFGTISVPLASGVILVVGVVLAYQQTTNNVPCKSTGNPVDVVSGALWYQQADAALSGPDPITFFHRYQSTFAQGAVSGGASQQPPLDMGVGWRHAYDGYIDVTNFASGYVTLNKNDCGLEYFQVAAAGTASSSYDPNSGDQLAVSTSGSFTLTTWNGQVMQFDTQGLLSSITDRIGNTQTIARNPDKTMASVTDVLGRSLSFGYDTSKRITSVSSSPTGISLSFTYDTGTNCYSGELCTMTESDGKTWTYEYYNPTSYNGISLLEYVIDPLGHTEEYNQYAFYSGDTYRVSQQQQDSGKNTRSFAYSLGSTSGTTTITDSLGAGHTTTYTWSPLIQEVTSVNGPECRCNGNQLSFTYDAFGRMLSKSEGSGTSQLTQTMEYGRDTIYTSPDGRTTYPIFAYPGATAVDSRGLTTISGTQTSTTSYAYYPLADIRKDLVQTQTEPSVDTAGSNVVTTFTYGTTGLLTSVARQGYIGGTSTTYTAAATYDAKGRVQTTTGPRTDVSQVTHYAYYPDTDTDLSRRGQLDTITDPASHVTTFAGAASPYNTYNIYGSPLSVVDPNGVTTDFSFDARNRMLTSVLKGVTGDTADRTTSYAYDFIGKLIGTTLPLLNGQQLVYDSNNNLMNTILLDASGFQHDQAVNTYDSMSRLVGHTFQSCTTPAATCAAWTTTYSDVPAYTGLDNLQSVTYPTGGATSYTYDHFGNAASVSTGDSTYSVTNSALYDLQHQQTSASLGSNTLSYSSDLQFNQVNVSPAYGVATQDTYDDFHRLEKRVSPFTGTSTYSYDPAGNLTSTTDGNGATTATTFDVLNRPLVATSTRSGYTTETVTRTYDDATSGHFGLGRLASMTDPSGSTTYTYERHGFIKSQVQIANGTTFTTGYTYDGNGNRQTVTLPSTRVLTYTHDYADRPASVASATTTYVSSATYEPFGPLSVLTFGNGTTQTKSFTQRYLISENKLVHSTTTLSDVTFAENATGYLTSATDALNAGYNQTFAYGGRATNMLTSAQSGSSLWGNAQFADTYNQNISTLALTGDNFGLTYNRAGLLTSIYNNDTATSQAVTEDGAGNELTVGSTTYAYSSRNHLSSGDGVTYTYDGMGRRVSATATAGTRTSIYDPDMHLQMETALGSGAVAYDYIWFAGVPVAQEDIGGNTHWTATDYRNAPFIQTTSAGAAYWQADYAPFGAIYALRASDVHQPLRMPGQEAEEFATGNANGYTGRLYNGFRWYRPLIGRYTQADPIGYIAGSNSLYSYAQSNPEAYYDPFALALQIIGGWANQLIMPGSGYSGAIVAGVNLDWGNSTVFFQAQKNVSNDTTGSFVGTGGFIGAGNGPDPVRGMDVENGYHESDIGVGPALGYNYTTDAQGNTISSTSNVPYSLGLGVGNAAFEGRSATFSAISPTLSQAWTLAVNKAVSTAASVASSIASSAAAAARAAATAVAKAQGHC